MKHEGVDKKKESRLFFLFRLSFFVGLAIYYLFLNVFPWGWIYEFGWYQGFTRVMSEIIPSITRLPPEAQIGGPAHSIAQLSFIHFSGLVLWVVTVFKIHPLQLKKNARTFNLYIAMISALLLTLAISWMIFFWEGTFNVSVKETYFRNERELTGFTTIVWYLFIGMFVYTWAIFLSLTIRIRNFLINLI